MRVSVEPCIIFASRRTLVDLEYDVHCLFVHVIWNTAADDLYKLVRTPPSTAQARYIPREQPWPYTRTVVTLAFPAYRYMIPLTIPTRHTVSSAEDRPQTSLAPTPPLVQLYGPITRLTSQRCDSVLPVITAGGSFVFSTLSSAFKSIS
jgi:hypothetical protein